MKKQIINIIILFVLFSTNVISQTSDIFIKSDERIELLYTIEYLAKSPFVSHHQTLIKWEIDDYFLKYKNHKAVILFSKMEKEFGFTYYRPLNWILQFSLPKFEKYRTAYDCGDLINKENSNYLEKFRLALIDFYKETNFKKFYSSHSKFYNDYLSEVKKSNTLLNIPIYLEEFYGTKLSSYNVILSPLLHQGGYNLEFKNNSNNIEVLAIIGPNGEIEFNPIFDTDFLEKDLMIHEFGHSFVNPLVDKNKKSILELEKLYYTDTLMRNAKREGYSDWISTFDEILVRTNTIIITEKYYGEESAKELLNYEINAGFNIIPMIIEIMQDYSKNRTKYPTYEDFLPILIKRLKNNKRP
jgi:hypothetical protein